MVVWRGDCMGGMETYDKVVLAAFLLDYVAGLVAQDADLLVGILTRAT